MNCQSRVVAECVVVGVGNRIWKILGLHSDARLFVRKKALILRDLISSTRVVLKEVVG